MAPSKQRQRYKHCDPEVKRLFPTHQRCNLIKEAQTFTGKQINHYLNLPDALEKSKNYRVCSNIADKIKNLSAFPTASPPQQRSPCNHLPSTPPETTARKRSAALCEVMSVDLK